MLRKMLYTLERPAVLAALAIIVILGFMPGRAAALTCNVTPDRIPIDISYHGQKVIVAGVAAAGDDLIVKISAEAANSHLKYKGKAAGIFWMKMGDMEFEHVPGFYLLFTSDKLDELLDFEQRKSHQLGYLALGRQIEIKGPVGPEDRDRWFGEFIKFKEKDGLYAVREGAVATGPGASGEDYRLEVPWPYQASPGSYRVEVLAVRNGRVVDRAESSIEVARAGMVAQLSSLAFKNAAVYGVMAIVIAMAAGFAVGALFKKGGGAH